jgi:hypothetical protein
MSYLAVTKPNYLIKGINMEYCINCKNYQHTKRSIIGDSDTLVQWCLKNPFLNLVTGAPSYRMAEVERTIVNDPTHCGRDAAWFEPIEDADLDDLSNIPFGK